MDREPQTEQEAQPKGGKLPPLRPWTQRTQPDRPIPFVRFHGTDAEGHPAIIYRFGEPGGRGDVPNEVYAILDGLKRLDHPNGGQYSTHLRFKRDKEHGRVWTLPNNPQGRHTADVLDARLLDLARRMEQEQDSGKGR